MMSDVSVKADVLKYCFTDSKNDSLNLENCALILPIALNLIETKYEVYIRTGILVVNSLIKQFKALITATLSTPVIMGVDFSREERVKKCEACIQNFKVINDSASLEKNSKRENQTGDLAKELKRNLEMFLNDIRRV